MVFNDTSALGLFDFLNGKIPESSNPNDVSAVKEKSSIGKTKEAIFGHYFDMENDNIILKMNLHQTLL